ncbi:unnamed protein product [Paramecium sonneborni]|uniref:Protein kinase domain-containing protein n=1 Tax=Paramecium sonneborni TaxID=65129 RepID=A0A8S1R7N6_9CILI|nr:unnamed protein product [Paramecium sonneborni]
MICKTKHYFFDHQYEVYIVKDQILIGKQKDCVKYKVPFQNKMLISWMFQQGKLTGFKILLREKWKQFDMNNENCLNLKSMVDGKIGYRKIESLYKILDTVGLGSYSEVLLIESYLNNQKYIAKKMAINSKNVQSLFNNELYALQNLKHKHIIQMKEFYVGFADAYIIMNYIDGESLAKYMRYNKKISIKEMINILKQLFEALEYIHKNGFIHRDIKPENILFDKDHRFLTLIDFGFATKIEKQECNAGTPGYIAPEMFENASQTEKCDIFSLGCILYELIYGKKLFQGNCLKEIQLVNMRCQYSLQLNEHPLHNLLCKMLEKDMSIRIVAKEGLNLLEQYEQSTQI